MPYLITYSYIRKGSSDVKFKYDLADSPIEWLQAINEMKNGAYRLINILEVSGKDDIKFIKDWLI